MMQQYSDTEKLHTKIEAQKNLIYKRSTTWSCCPPATAMKERRSLWPAGWYPENW